MKKAIAKIVLYKSYKNALGEYPVMLRVTKDSKLAYLSTGYFFKEKDWDSENKRPDKKHSLFDELKLHFVNIETEANRVILDLIRSNEQFDAKSVINKLKKKDNDNDNKIVKTNLWDYFDVVIKRKEQIGSFNYKTAFFETKRMLKSFCNESILYFDDIDHKFLVEFEVYLKSKEKRNKKGKQSPNTVFLYLRTFRTLINYAIKEGLFTKEKDPFINFSLNAYRKVKTRKRAITKTEILKILNANIPEDSLLFDSRNYFVFSYLCWGMNFIDLAYLKWNNIVNGRLTYNRRKTTSDKFEILLLEPALKILEHYEQFKNSENDYVFPILNSRHSTPLKEFNRIRKVLRQLNTDINTIAEDLGINVHLTSYVARHTFANVQKNANVSQSIISQQMGHETEKQTNTYLMDFGNDLLDEASKNLI